MYFFNRVQFFFDMLRVAVIGGGPSGSCAAEILAKSGIKTWLFERKLDNAKPCGGAIPLCMVEEFDLPETIIDRKVRHMKMISPSNREVDISLDNVYGKSDNEYIGMCRREVMDAFMSCLLYTSPSPRDATLSRMPSSA